MNTGSVPSAMTRVMRILQPAAPFLVAIWTVAAWLVLRQTAGGFLALFITVPVAFLQMAVLGFLLWMRPSVRLQGTYRSDDYLWYFLTLGLWLVGAVLPSQVSGLVQVVAFAVGAVAIYRIGTGSQQENLETLRQQFDPTGSMRAPGFDDFATPTAGFGDGGDSTTTWQHTRIITIDTTPTRGRADATGRQYEVVDGEIIDEPTPRLRDQDEPDEWIARPHRD